MSITPKNNVDLEEQPNHPVTYNDIAGKLLKDRLLLTALEFHTELVESGRELKQLRNFFSNPSNFEGQVQETVSLISRSESQVTLDSLDLTRYSEDGERSVDERIAVLEFELRKAKDTISALRNNLTVAIEDASTPIKNAVKLLSSGNIKPHEQRALNFLINEYLLQYGYKLTSITFADENESQDFEDWDDVGVNISQPSELLTLYREGLKQTGHNCCSSGCQTEDKEFDQMKSDAEQYAIDIETLKKQVIILKCENEDLKNRSTETVEEESITDDLIYVNESKKKSSSKSNSPENFEIIDKNKLHSAEQDSIITFEDSISNTSNNDGEWTNVALNLSDPEIKQENTEYNKNFSKFSDKYKNEILSQCFGNITSDNEIMNCVLNQAVTSEKLVTVLSHSLLSIIPNVILNKREEVIPLIVSAVYLNRNSTERDKLLHQLFNLKKKPMKEERFKILLGVMAIAKHSKNNLIENEVLPHCWEQLTHKHTEKRLLIAESCCVLAPYISSSLRNSLIVSMLQQLLEDHEAVVRETAIRAISLITSLCDDVDKYKHFEAMALNSLSDSSNVVATTSIQLFFPILAKWALDRGCLGSDLIKNLLHRLNKDLKDLHLIESSENIIRILCVLDNLLPFLLMHIASNEVVLNKIDKNMAAELSSDLLNCTNLTNPLYFYHSDSNPGMVLYLFDRLFLENSPNPWPELNWFIDIVLPDLLNSLNHIDIAQHSILESFIKLFSHMCTIFGDNFRKQVIRPIIHSHVQNLEQILANFNQYSPNLNIISVYLVSVLSYPDSTEELSNILKRFLYALPLSGTPLDCLEITIRGLCDNNMQEIVVTCLWDGVVHQRPLVRAATATLFSSVIRFCNENLLATKVAPALVTLASDSDILVRTAALSALAHLIIDCTSTSIHDKVYMQIQTYLSDPTTKENHSLLRQLVITLGNISNVSKIAFRDKVILPQLNACCTFTSQMSNQTRKVDMATALLEAFSKVIYSPVNEQIVHNVLLPGLRCLQTMINENSSLTVHRDSITSLIREAENRLTPPSSQLTDRSVQNQTVTQSVEEMKQRVTKMFNKPPGIKSPSLTNLQGVFKKK